VFGGGGVGMEMRYLDNSQQRKQDQTQKRDYRQSR
jgi:hypothetical protein